MLQDTLSKSLLMGLPENCYIASNILKPDGGGPAYAAKISSIANRNEQWKDIVHAQVSQRLCYIFTNNKDFMHWIHLVSTRKYIFPDDDLSL